MAAGPSRAEQQEAAWWNETMNGIGSTTDSGAVANATALLDSMASQAGTGTGETYDTGLGGRDWLAFFFMTFGKDTSGRAKRFGDHHRTHPLKLTISAFPFW